MCDKAGIGDMEYSVTPLGNPGLSRLFAVGFVGDNEKTNSLRAKKARQCLRNKDGSWLELVVPTPTGENIKAYINPDKSPKVERVEELSKVLFRNCATEFPDFCFP